MSYTIVLHMVSNEYIYENQSLELRRGTTVLAILNLLQQSMYGYGLQQALEKAGVVIEAGTLYPLLRRLEKQGILASVWNTQDARPRKYYKLTSGGEILYDRMKTEWFQINEKISVMIEGK
jgi:PadR family transcriptional regulator PadR